MKYRITTMILLIIAAVFLLTSYANATFIFSDAEMTTTTFTFTIDGDMTGYSTTPSSKDYRFCIEYFGYDEPLYGSNNTATYNSWYNQIFDNVTISSSGHTVPGGEGYSHYSYVDMSIDSSLSGATANNRTVTLTIDHAYFRPENSGIISFYWGSIGNSGDVPVSLGSVGYNTPDQAAPVPEPATCLLLGVGLAGIAAGKKKFMKK